MPKFTYTPDEDQKVHQQGAIDLICKPYQSHENGLPEWLKNSADAYVREDSPPSKRVIVVVLDYGRAKIPPSISCLDFCGMSSREIEEFFRVWADPEAASHGEKSSGVQGGHGNGGKCYMTQMFDEYSYIHTVKNDKGCRYGVEGGLTLFGYIPDPREGKDFQVVDLKAELAAVIKPLRCTFNSLPKAALQALNVASGFSLISGVAPKGYSNKIPVTQILSTLQEHIQMIRTLELCQVFVLEKGKILNDGLPLSLPKIPPMKGAEDPRIIKFPPVLKDPQSGEKIDIPLNRDGKQGTLTLNTSNVSMRYSKKLRHNIVFRTYSGFVGYVEVTELDVQSSYRDRIYGECNLDAIEPYKQNERARPARSPTTRAVESFFSRQVGKYSKEFEERDKYQYDKEEKNALSTINEALDKWKNRFLGEYMQGLWGAGIGNPPPPLPSLPSGKPARIDVRLTHHRAGLGVSFRPSIRFFDKNGRHIKPSSYRWISEDSNVALVDEDLIVINTFSYGQTRIYAETEDGKITSNLVPLEVINIQDIKITPKSIELPVGSRNKFEVVCKLASGEEISGVYLIWTESNPNIVRVSSSGLAFGFAQGEAQIVAGDDRCLSSEPVSVLVVEGVGSGKGDKRGKGYPLVLVSGNINRDPETEDFVHLSKDDPPVYQRVQDVARNIWWINSSSPLARLYLSKERDFGYQSREWRMYHLERYIDIIVQIALTHGPRESELISVNDWIMRWGAQAAEVHEAAVADLANFIATGDLPQ